EGATRRAHSAGVHGAYPLRGGHRDVETLQKLRRGLGDAFRQLRQDARGSLDNGQTDVFPRLELVEPISCMRSRTVADLCGKPDAGRARADDDDIYTRRPAMRGSAVGAHAG